ncbi:MAG: prepilin peptidase [Firmicutes bacterium]|nr:prepilin peptidase [Bacillota bacterium]
METILSIVIFIFGLVVGSFLNVCAYRIPKGESIAYPPSHCPTCGSQIKPWDNIPLLSYIILRGKCRSCGQKISLRYPVVELLTGILWVSIYWQYGVSNRMVLGIFFVTVLIVLSVIDFNIRLIPDKILLPSMLVSFAFLILCPLKIASLPVIAGIRPLWAIAGFFAGGGSLYLIAALAPLIFKKQAMGGGDIKLAAFMGLYLGGYVFVALFIGFFLGALIGIALIVLGKRSMQDMIPFGPFLAAGAILTIFFGPQLWHGYLSLAGLQ